MLFVLYIHSSIIYICVKNRKILSSEGKSLGMEGKILGSEAKLLGYWG
jgi:hypothetical protein